MANWQRELNLTPEWGNTDAGDVYQLQKLAGVISQRLERVKPFNIALADDEKEVLVENFREASEDEELNVRYFDSLMQDLYNWADTSLDEKFGGKKVCWVKTR